MIKDKKDFQWVKVEQSLTVDMLDHPFICKTFSSFETWNYFNLLIELCPGGELFFHINLNSVFDEDTARFYFC